MSSRHLLYLDHDRGVPQPAGDLGGGPGLVHHPAIQRAQAFNFPAGIGPVECVNVEHEEVLLMPRWLQPQRVTFKYGLGAEFIGVLRTLHMLGLDSTDPVQVGGSAVAPRDVVAACLPDPATLGDRMTGVTCAGTWVTGTGKDCASAASGSTFTTRWITGGLWPNMGLRRWCGRPRSIPSWRWS